MVKFTRSLVLFIFPSFLSFPLLRMFGFKISGRVGFSWIDVNKIEFGVKTRIGHFNFIKVPLLTLSDRSVINHFNLIKGNFSLKMDELSCINLFNKITSVLGTSDQTKFTLGYNSIIGTHHLIDMAGSFSMGDNSILAGSGSQVWTHGFYHSKIGTDRWRIDGNVSIGNNVYVGTRVIFCAGVSVCDICTIGANVVISKDIITSGLYVNQPLRVIEFDPDIAITKYKKISDTIYEK